MNYNYIAHNIEVVEVLQFNEENNGTKIFKYATYQQMADIYVNGKMKKEQIEVKPIISNDGYLTPMQFEATANEFAKFREAGIEEATQPELIGLI